MAADLTLPGDIPGLLRRGCPVVGTYTGARGVVVEDVRIHPELGPGVRASTGFEASFGRLKALALDLSDEAGRDRAVRWLAERVGLDAPAGLLWYRCSQGWRLYTLYTWRSFIEHEDDRVDPSDILVPALVDLDNPNADTTRALIAVCLHVAGRSA